LIRDPEQAVRQVLSFIAEGALITRTGKKIPSRIHTFCTHGDEPTGPAVAPPFGQRSRRTKYGWSLPELTYE
jgi:lactam utilization protein B